MREKSRKCLWRYCLYSKNSVKSIMQFQEHLVVDAPSVSHLPVCEHQLTKISSIKSIDDTASSCCRYIRMNIYFIRNPAVEGPCGSCVDMSGWRPSFATIRISVFTCGDGPHSKTVSPSCTMGFLRAQIIPIFCSTLAESIETIESVVLEILS